MYCATPDNYRGHTCVETVKRSAGKLNGKLRIPSPDVRGERPGLVQIDRSGATLFCGWAHQLPVRKWMNVRSLGERQGLRQRIRAVECARLAKSYQLPCQTSPAPSFNGSLPRSRTPRHRSIGRVAPRQTQWRHGPNLTRGPLMISLLLGLGIFEIVCEADPTNQSCASDPHPASLPSAILGLGCHQRCC